MSHARIEEVSDSDPEIDDPSTYLPHSDSNIIVPANLSAPQPGHQQQHGQFTRDPNPSPHPSLIKPSQMPGINLQPTPRSAAPQSREQIKSYISIYPVYFDASRTHSTGRRVPSSLATANPLAHSILLALPAVLGPHMLPTAFEPDKTHPKDWANPGRVRVQLFSDDAAHRPLHPDVQNKRHLFRLIAKHLQSHPTMPDDPLRLPIAGLQPPEDGLKAPAVPRGWKVNAVVPMHSPAMSGGGVSDNFLKDAMEEMRAMQAEQGGAIPQLPPGMAAMMGGGGAGPAAADGAVGKKKKDKKKG